MSDKLEKRLLSNEPLSQEDIKALYSNGMALLGKARALHALALARINMAQDLCNHPNKKGGYVCPDCGYDTSPDGY